VDATPNNEQIKSIIRWFVSTFGGAIAGWFAAKGWFTIDQVLSVLNSPTLLGIAASIGAAIWSLLTHTKGNAVAVADAIPDVAGVVMKATDEGKKIAETVPSETVAVEGTAAAAAVAAK